MKLRLKELRKNKGFRSRAVFAEMIGVPERRVKAWETGESLIQLDDACIVADVLECSLDDLVGRIPPKHNSDDPLLKAFYDDYGNLSESGRAAAIAAVHGIRLSEDGGKECPPPDCLKINFELVLQWFRPVFSRAGGFACRSSFGRRFR